MALDETPAETLALERFLANHLIADIQRAEGWRSAREVAKEFRITSERVRSIWDGFDTGRSPYSDTETDNDY